MKLINIYEAGKTKDTDIDVSNLEYKDYFTIRLNAQGSMKGMTQAERSDLFKSIGKEWKVLKSKDKTKMKKENTSNIDELFVRKTIRAEISKALNEWDDEDDRDDYGGEYETTYYDDESLTSKLYEKAQDELADMYKFMDKHNDAYIKDNLLVGLFDGIELSEIFHKNNNKLQAYYRQHAKQIKTKEFNEMIIPQSDYQDGYGAYEDSGSDRTLHLDLNIDRFISSGYKVSELFYGCRELDELYNYSTSESFIFDWSYKNHNADEEDRADALIADVHSWFVKHEKNIINLIEDYIF